MKKQIFITLAILLLLFIITPGTVIGLPVAATGSLVQAQTQSQIFTPVGDTHVVQARPNRNFGSRRRIRTLNNSGRIIYLKFDVQGIGNMSSATLKVFAQSSNSQGINIHAVSDTTWGERTLKWNNAPPLGSIIATTGPIQSGNWYQIDVSTAVLGDGLVTFAITDSPASATTITSRESSNSPELHISAASPPPTQSPDPFVVRRDGNTYYAESQTTTSAYSGSLKTVVQSAANELNSFAGGTITFQAGDFDLGADWLEFYDLRDITFAGQGIDTTILRNDTDAATDTEPFDFTRSNRITIQDMTISANGAYRSTSDAIDFDAGNNNTVDRVKITSSRSRGIIFDGKDTHSGEPQTANFNLVRDCIITGVRGDGIELLASSLNRIENCQIYDVGGHGIQINKSSSSAGQPHKMSTHNLISGNQIDNAGGDGINVISGYRNLLTGNTILNSSDDTLNQDGIQITSGNAIPCDDNIVHFNTITDNQAVKTQRYGLNISSANCNRTAVADNIIFGNRIGDILDNGTNTVFTTLDNQPPTIPSGLTATNITYASVDLSWETATDNVEVASYTIYRDGTSVGTVNSPSTTYQDTTVTYLTSYTYTVEAFDAAGNGSGQSAPLPVTTASPPSTFNILAAADTYVDANSPTSNRGSLSILRIDSTPERNVYMRFDIQGVVGTVTQVTLRIYANSSSPVGYELHPLNDNNWEESTITYANAPTFGPVVASSGPFSSQTWTEIDVTQFWNGNGTYDLAMTTPHTTAISFGSRESANPPELIINVDHP